IKKSPQRRIFVTSYGTMISDSIVNEYLKEFGITAKDLRGFFSNDSIIFKLNSIDIPETEKLRKKLFNKVLKDTAHKVGHGSATLRKHYMIPELDTNYIQNGKIIDLKKLGYYEDGGEPENFSDSEKENNLILTNITKHGFHNVISGTSQVANGATIQAALTNIRRDESSGTSSKRTNAESEYEKLIGFINE